MDRPHRLELPAHHRLAHRMAQRLHEECTVGIVVAELLRVDAVRLGPEALPMSLDREHSTVFGKGFVQISTPQF